MLQEQAQLLYIAFESGGMLVACGLHYTDLWRFHVTLEFNQNVGACTDLIHDGAKIKC